MSTNRRSKHIFCYDATCERCNTGKERIGHTIEIEYLGSVDMVRVNLDDKNILCMSDDIWDAICELDQKDI